MTQVMEFMSKFTIFNILDIAIVSFVIYRVIMLIRGTRAVQLLKGVMVLLIAAGISSFLHLQALSWLLNRVLEIGLFAIPVVFQPELRRALEQLGRSNWLSVSTHWQGTKTLPQTVHELVKATQVLAKNRIGALIVLERSTGLNEYIETGITIEGVLSSELLINTFIPNTPLHDGALIMRVDRIIAAACFLPLSDQSNLAKELGTRHRAAVGITEQTDALVIVVSEETGTISIAENGVLTRDFDEGSLTERLITGLAEQQNNTFRWMGRKAGKK